MMEELSALDTLERDGVVHLKEFIPVEVVGVFRLLSRLLYSYFIAPPIGVQSDEEKILRAMCAEWNGLQIDLVEKFLSEYGNVKEVMLTPLLETVHRCVRNRFFCFTPDGYGLHQELSFFRRCMVGQTSAVPWHNDAEAANSLGCLSVWMPLDKVGEVLPSLEFIRGSHRYMREHFRPGVWPFHRVDEWVDKRVLGERFTPHMWPGDVVVFDASTLHRTQQLVAPIHRSSCEFRFSGCCEFRFSGWRK